MSETEPPPAHLGEGDGARLARASPGCNVMGCGRRAVSVSSHYPQAPKKGGGVRVSWSISFFSSPSQLRRPTTLAPRPPPSYPALLCLLLLSPTPSQQVRVCVLLHAMN